MKPTGAAKCARGANEQTASEVPPVAKSVFCFVADEQNPIFSGRSVTERAGLRNAPELLMTVAEETQKKPPHRSARVFLNRSDNDDGDYKKKTTHCLLSLDTHLVCESNQVHEAKRKQHLRQ